MINVIPARRARGAEIDGFNIRMAPKPDPGDNELEFCDTCWNSVIKVLVFYLEEGVFKICESCASRAAAAIQKVEQNDV